MRSSASAKIGAISGVVAIRSERMICCKSKQTTSKATPTLTSPFPCSLASGASRAVLRTTILPLPDMDGHLIGALAERAWVLQIPAQLPCRTRRSRRPILASVAENGTAQRHSPDLDGHGPLDVDFDPLPAGVPERAVPFGLRPFGPQRGTDGVWLGGRQRALSSR